MSGRDQRKSGNIREFYFIFFFTFVFYFYISLISSAFMLYVAKKR